MSFTAGTLVQTGADYAITAMGSGIGTASDQWSMGLVSVTGNTTIICEYKGITGDTGSTGFVGIGFRGTTDPGSQAVHTLLTHSGIASYYRSIATQSTTQVATSSGATLAGDIWLKISRATNLFSFYFSSDSLNWQALGSITLALPSACYIGIIAGSGNTTYQVTATMGQVNIQNLASPTYTFTGLANSTAYSLTAVAQDGAGNTSAASAAISVTTGSAATHAYTLRSVGTADQQNGTSLSPGAPAGKQVGDLLTMMVWSRDSTKTVTPPSGWTALSDNVNVTWTYLYGRIADGTGSDTPTLTYSGTAHIGAQIACFTGNVFGTIGSIVAAAADEFLPGTQISILYPALTVPQANCLVIAMGTKNKTATSDGTSVNNLSGLTKIDTHTATGTAVSQWWGYVQQTAAANFATATQTLTGTTETLQYTSAVIALKTA